MITVAIKAEIKEMHGLTIKTKISSPKNSS
jgi:hypothetical protein